MNLRDLEYLVAVHELGHFTRAAERCCVSQPTLSGQLRKLEDELGVALFERSTRKVIITEVGQNIVAPAREILSGVQDIRQLALAAADPLAGPLHVGLIPTVGPYLLPHIMPRLRAALPKLEIFLYELKTADLLTRLHTGAIDCGILALVDGLEGLEYQALYQEELLLAAPGGHPLLDKPILRRDDLSGQTVLMLEDGHCLRDQALGVCFAAGAEEDQHYRATSLNTLQYMVRNEAGITLMPRLAIGDGMSGVEYREFDRAAPAREIGLVSRPAGARRAAVAEVGVQIQETLEAVLPQNTSQSRAAR